MSQGGAGLQQQPLQKNVVTKEKSKSSSDILERREDDGVGGAGKVCLPRRDECASERCEIISSDC